MFTIQYELCPKRLIVKAYLLHFDYINKQAKMKQTNAKRIYKSGLAYYDLRRGLY